MERIRQSLALLLVLTIATSTLILLASVPAGAQSTTTKPSTLMFSIRYVDNSYDILPTYGVDQFTGETVITKQGDHVENKSFVFTIENQPFTSYINSYGYNVSLCYNLRFKGTYGTNWMYFPFDDNGVGVGRCSASIYSIFNPDLAALLGIYHDN